MRAGSLRDRIAIYVDTVIGQDTYGQDAKETTLVGEFWSQVEHLQGREFERAQQRWAEARYKILMRAGPEIKAAMTASWQGRTLDILGVESLENRTRPELCLYAKDHEG